MACKDKSRIYMAGYSGFSMSNNAVDAYENGEKPLSKWKKSDIVEAVESYRQENELLFSMELFKKIPLPVMKEKFLYKKSYHHTSSHYNRTDFYTIDDVELDELSDDRIESIICEGKNASKAENIPTEETWECTFLEWSGTRKHPKATEITEVGVIRGDWFYRKDGSKKKTTANGFRRIKRIL